ncbi:hypothetical protein SHJG_3408 [Streptomyces hygroscopicus subsp. jinggangensis 5008]|nr:hypothetical protein SHJG_3408 [Streptomyces hygroscopicus subsp. jinggangensis 5008]AGF62839.1 hypothetical protein SHJGH_3173 [Streptomyces hygroscopicus subsp. jinggangensis TL01]
MLVTEPVHPRRVRDVSRPGAVAGGVGHVSHPTGEHRHRVGPVDNARTRTASARWPRGTPSGLRPGGGRVRGPCPSARPQVASRHAGDAPPGVVSPAKPWMRQAAAPPRPPTPPSGRGTAGSGQSSGTAGS